MYRHVAGVGFALCIAAGAAADDSAPQYRPSPGGQPPVPVIRAAPVQSACDSYNEMLTMARMGRESANAPAFTDAIAPLSRGYFGGPTCKAWVSSEGGHTVNARLRGRTKLGRPRP